MRTALLVVAVLGWLAITVVLAWPLIHEVWPRRSRPPRGVILWELLAGLAGAAALVLSLRWAWRALLVAAALLGGCAPQLSGYAAQFGGGGAQLTAYLPPPVDASTAIEALQEAAAQAGCPTCHVELSRIECPPPKRGEVQQCTVTGMMTGVRP